MRRGRLGPKQGKRGWAATRVGRAGGGEAGSDGEGQQTGTERAGDRARALSGDQKDRVTASHLVFKQGILLFLNKNTFTPVTLIYTIS